MKNLLILDSAVRVSIHMQLDNKLTAFRSTRSVLCVATCPKSTHQISSYFNFESCAVISVSPTSSANKKTRTCLSRYH
jgi:hypothetical protein